MNTAPEIAFYACACCGTAVETQWAADGGGMLRGDNVLVANWVFHPSCWDMMVRENPPFGNS
jgi:hypothetical protein